MKKFGNKKMYGFIFGMLIGILITSGVGVVAITLGADSITYTPTNTDFKNSDGTVVDHTDEALDVLYEMAKNSLNSSGALGVHAVRDSASKSLPAGKYACVLSVYTNGDYSNSVYVRRGGTGGVNILSLSVAGGSGAKSNVSTGSFNLTGQTTISVVTEISSTTNLNQKRASVACYRSGNTN